MFATHSGIFFGSLLDHHKIRLLQSQAQEFFGNLQRWLSELIFLKTARLIDPEVTGKKKNLTVPYFAAKLRDSRHGEEIRVLSNNTTAFAAKVKAARNQFVAHADLDTLRKPGFFFGVTEFAVKEFFENLDAFCGIVSSELGVEYVSIAPFQTPKSVEDVIGVFNDSELFRNRGGFND